MTAPFPGDRVAGRTGKLFADRYHLRVLESPSEVRNCLVYVLRNGVRHGASPAGPVFDVYSSAMYFDGWTERPRLPVIDDGERPTVTPRTWLLATGWRRGGAISFEDEPRRGATRGGAR